MVEIASILLNLNLSTAPNLDADSFVSSSSTGIQNSATHLLRENSSLIRIAHEVRTSNEVGGTIHIEPNDRPIAGQKSRVWIALTKRGGEIIPYGKCNCSLEVRSLTNKNIKFRVSKSASILDRYLGLPSIEVIFPQVGRYELQLSGSARESVDFQPFELTFTINVGK